MANSKSVMGLLPTNPTPFQRFEGEYLACWEAAQEVTQKLTPSNAQSSLRLMCIALLKHFERFCIEQCIEIAALRPKLVRRIQPPRIPFTGEIVNRSFRKLVGGNILSRLDLKHLQKIAREASATHSRANMPKSQTDWTEHLNAIFDLAVKIARSTGSAVTRGLPLGTAGNRKIAAAAARLLRARYDSLA